MHQWYGDGQMGWMAIWWALGLALVVLVVWALFNAGRGRGRGEGAVGESPEAILKRRYAKGEIDGETYRRMLTDLKG